MEYKDVNFDNWSMRAYHCACIHGFHDNSFSDEHWMMLTIGEVGEMVEAHRKGKFAKVKEFRSSDTVNDDLFKDKFNRFVKDSMEDEMADIAIRLLDYAGLKKISINEHIQNRIRFLLDSNICPYVENLSVSEYGFAMTEDLVLCTEYNGSTSITSIISNLIMLAHCCHIDLPWHIEQKMRYNELRPRLNGKRY